jgi:trk system potassium uptake protein TrkA
MKKNFAVIGLGQFGSQVALTLEKLGQQVFAFDKDEEAVSQLKNYVTSITILDCSDKACLSESGISSCDVALVCIKTNTPDLFLTVLNLKEMGIPTIIARANSPEEGVILEKIGATRVIYPEKESAIRLANQITSSDILEFIEISPDYQVAEVPAPKEFISNTIEELNLRAKYKISILAIRRDDKVMVIPSADEKIKVEDILVIVGATSDIVDFSKKFHPKVNGRKK